jgi:transposase
MPALCDDDVSLVAGNKGVSGLTWEKICPQEVSAALWITDPDAVARGAEVAARRAARLSDELALNGILFVLRTGTPWEYLPQELGFGSGMTCWRWLREWQAAGVWHPLHLLLLAELRGAGWLDVSRVSLGSKRHLITARQGIPLMFCVTGANRQDSVVFEERVDALPSVAGRRGRPRWPAVSSAFDRCRPFVSRSKSAISRQISCDEPPFNCYWRTSPGTVTADAAGAVGATLGTRGAKGGQGRLTRRWLRRAVASGYAGTRTARRAASMVAISASSE